MKPFEQLIEIDAIRKELYKWLTPRDWSRLIQTNRFVAQCCSWKAERNGFLYTQQVFDRIICCKQFDLVFSIPFRQNGVDPMANDNYALCWAAENGRLDVVQYLVSLRDQFPKIDPAAYDNYALCLAAENGHLDVLKYLVSIRDQFPKIDPTADNNYALRWAAYNGHLDVVKYLVSIHDQFPAIDPAANDNFALRNAAYNRHLDVVKYLVSLRDQFPAIDPAACDYTFFC